MIMKECNTLRKALTKYNKKKRLLNLFPFLLTLFIHTLGYSEEDKKLRDLNPLTAKGHLNYSQEKGFYVTINLYLENGYKAYVDQFDLLFRKHDRTKISTENKRPSLKQNIEDQSTLELKKNKLAQKNEHLLTNIKVLKPLNIAPVVKIKDRFSGGKTREVIIESAHLVAFLKRVPDKLSDSLIAQVKYQACTETHCLFPKFTDTFITVSNTAKEMASVNSFDKKVFNEGLLSLFLFVFLAGILTSLTPCIFPMIPITLSILGSQTVDQRSKLSGFILSTVYVSGIAITYAVMGLLAAKSGALFGSALSQPIIVYSLATLFICMAMSMYGLYDLQLPGFLRNKLHSYKGIEGGLTKAFFGGLISGVAAGPCVGPVLISILAYVAKTQDAFFGFWLLLVYAVGLGMIFILLGTFSTLLSRLPKSGPWLNTVKGFFGFLMIIMALYYIEPVTDPTYFKIIVGVTFITLGVVRGFIALKTLRTRHDVFKRSLAIVIILIGTGGIGHGLLEITNIIPQTDTLAPSKNNNFEVYSEEKLQRALLSEQPVIIDFYADWCLACKELDRYIFSKPDIQSLMSQFLLLKVDLTIETTKTAPIREKYNILGLPTILFIHPNGDIISKETLTGFEPANQFKKRIKRVLKTL